MVYRYNCTLYKWGINTGTPSVNCINTYKYSHTLYKWCTDTPRQVLVKELGSEAEVEKALSVADDPFATAWRGRAAEVSSLKRQVRAGDCTARGRSEAPHGVQCAEALGQNEEESTTPGCTTFGSTNLVVPLYFRVFSIQFL